jgi:hypothetical protein
MAKKKLAQYHVVAAKQKLRVAPTFLRPLGTEPWVLLVWVVQYEAWAELGQLYAGELDLTGCHLWTSVLKEQQE